jgi:hypothetical protein
MTRTTNSEDIPRLVFVGRAAGLKAARPQGVARHRRINASTVATLTHWWILGALLGATPHPPTPTVALHYGIYPPVSALAAFDWLVLEPANVRDEQLGDLKNLGVTGFARVAPAAGAPLDGLTAQALVLRRRGFSGVFLEGVEAAGDRARVLGWLHQLHARWPGIKLLIDRGFALFPEAAPLVSGVVADSLFTSYSQAASGEDRYGDVGEGEREALTARLRQIQPASWPGASPPWASSPGWDPDGWNGWVSAPWRWCPAGCSSCMTGVIRY